MSQRTIYFGYGSNLWIDQMKRRCPESKLVGIGFLENWKWIINTRGYANIIPSVGDIVYGLVFELTPSDEHDLDIYEGTTYEKQIIPVDVTPVKEPLSKETTQALIYIVWKAGRSPSKFARKLLHNNPPSTARISWRTGPRPPAIISKKISGRQWHVAS